MPAKPPTSSIDISAVADRFTLAAYYWLDSAYKPAVTEREGGGYRIRILRSRATHGRSITNRYSYFEISPDGIVLKSPYGHAADYNNTRITGLDEAVAEHADPASDVSQAALGL